MKNLILTIVFLALGTVFALAQTPYKPMNGNYKWSGNSWFPDSFLIDTGVVDVSSGLYLSLDTAGSSSTGYYVLEAAAASGTVSGTGAADRIAFWSGASTLSSNANFKYETSTGVMTIAAGSGATPLVVTGSNKSLDLLGVNIESSGINDANNVIVSEGTLDVAAENGSLIYGNNTGPYEIVINNDTSYATLTMKSSSSATPAVVVDLAQNRLGINVSNPSHPLTIDGGTGTAIKLTTPATTTGPSSATITNAPSAGNPTLYLVIDIDGTEYAIPCWLVP